MVNFGTAEFQLFFKTTATGLFTYFCWALPIPGLRTGIRSGIAAAENFDWAALDRDFTFKVQKRLPLLILRRYFTRSGTLLPEFTSGKY